MTSATLKGLAMAKKKAAKKPAKHNKVTVIVPEAITKLPDEVLERVAAAIWTAAKNYDVNEVEILASSHVVCTPSVATGNGGWDKIF
jgi:hypothetical protein